MQNNKAYLMLENGQIFEGKPFGAKGEALGEAIFTTSMAGYLETLSDPGHYGQIVIQTFPLIGNYGVIPSSFQSERFALSGYVVREWCEQPSNFRSEGDLDALLKEHGIPGIYGVDTRAITRAIRESGVMNACITQYDPRKCNLDSFTEMLSGYNIQNAVANVTSKDIRTIPAEDEKYRVVLWDMGARRAIVDELIKRGCTVILVPAGTPAKNILEMNPDGVVLSNGPGDPEQNPELIEEVRAVCASGLPVMGICLGHQLMALAAGARVFKLKYGHSGANQPVRAVDGDRVYITSQNHGYAVDGETVDASIGEVRFTNVNDGTCEGIRYKNGKAFSVQFYPETAAGPQDTGFLYDEFISMI